MMDENEGGIVTLLHSLEKKLEDVKLNQEQNRAILAKSAGTLKGLKKVIKLSKKIVTQMEYYFCDENLKNDIFMIGQLKKSSEGYISLKTVSNFKKIRKLSKNPKVIKKAISAFSTTLLLNQKQTRIKRRVPFIIADNFKMWIESAVLISRTGKKTMRELYRSISGIGKVLYFQVLNNDENRSAQKIVDSLKLDAAAEFKESDMKQNPLSTLKVCNGVSILVVYESKSIAKLAVDNLSEMNVNWRSGMIVKGFVKGLLKPTVAKPSSIDVGKSSNGSHTNIAPQEGSVVHAILSEKNKESFGKKTNRLQGRGSLAALLGEQESHGSQEPGQIVGRKQVIARRQRLFKNTKSGSLLDIVGLDSNMAAPISISKGPDGTRGFDSLYQDSRGYKKQFSVSAIEWVPLKA